MASNDIEKSPARAPESSASRNDDAPKPGAVAQDWTGPDDPENPQNWSAVKKSYHAIAVGILCFSVTAGTSMITPGTPEIERHFHVSQTAAILSLSMFVIGMAVGPMIAGPLSEYQGRRSVYLALPPIYLLFVMGAGFTNSFGGLLVLRFLAGATGSPPLAVGAGTIADMYLPAERVLPLSLYITTPFLGSGFGPVIGGFAAQYKGYKWTQWCTIFVGIASYAFSLMMKETYKKTILQRRAKILGLAPPAAGPKLGIGPYVTRLLRLTILIPIKMLLLEPIVFLLTLYNAFTFSVLFAFFAAYPYVFERVYGFSTWESGMPFLAIALGIAIAGVSGVLVDIWIYRPKLMKAKAEGRTGLDAEERLYSAMMGSFGIPVGLFWFAWTSRPSIHWIVPILSGIPFAWGSVAVFISAALYMTDTYGPMLGASAFAANGLGRYFMAAAFPLFTIQMYEYLGIDWASSLLAFLSLVMVPIPWVFYKYGPFLRARSHFRKPST